MENPVNFKVKPEYICLALVLLFAIIIRVQFLDVPLERDEGEYAYSASFLLKGISPLKHVYTIKPLGTSYIYAMIMTIFGQSIAGIRLGLLVINLLSIFILFLICRRLANDFTAVIASACFALMSAGRSVLGFAAHATHFVALFVLIGFLVLLKAIETKKRQFYIISGLMFGLSCLVKQVGLIFCFFGLATLIYSNVSAHKPERSYRGSFINAIIFLTGVVGPFILVVLNMIISGDFKLFYFWNVTLLKRYAVQMSLFQLPGIIKANIGY